mgnify:CR=1 FL=1
MKVLGIDPGTRIVGYAVVEEKGSRLIAHVYGAISTGSKDALPLRLKSIYDRLTEIIHSFHPDAVAIEKVFYGKNIQSAIRIGEGRGVAFLAASNAGLPVHEYDATKIKKSVVGSGGAHKVQIQTMVKAILGLPRTPEPFDAADALAIAICHHHLAKSLKLFE